MWIDANRTPRTAGVAAATVDARCRRSVHAQWAGGGHALRQHTAADSDTFLDNWLAGMREGRITSWTVRDAHDAFLGQASYSTSISTSAITMAKSATC
jgi:hypothetical protein